jgi:hypothetical protein
MVGVVPQWTNNGFSHLAVRFLSISPVVPLSILSRCSRLDDRSNRHTAPLFSAVQRSENYPGGSGSDSFGQILLQKSWKSRRASSNHDEFLPRIGRQSAQGFLSSVLQNEGDRLAKVRQAFFARRALTIGPRHFGAVGDVPWAVLLDDRRKLVVHMYILPPL